MPLKPLFESPKTALWSGCAVATAAALLALIYDPTATAQKRLDRLTDSGTLSMPVSTKVKQDTASLAQAPIFVMTTGPAAYKEETFQLFGLSMSPNRKAALVSIDGAAPEWIALGDVSGDVRLSAVGTNGATFDTPVGPRTVDMSDVSPTKSDNSAAVVPPAKGG